MLTFLDILFSCIVLTTGQTLSISPNPVIEGQPFTLKCSVSIDGAITFSHENIVRESCPAPFGTTLFPCSDTSIQQSIAAMETIWTVQSANSTTDEGNWKCSKGSDSPVVYLTVSSAAACTKPDWEKCLGIILGVTLGTEIILTVVVVVLILKEKIRLDEQKGPLRVFWIIVVIYVAITVVIYIIASVASILLICDDCGITVSEQLKAGCIPIPICFFVGLVCIRIIYYFYSDSTSEEPKPKPNPENGGGDGKPLPSGTLATNKVDAAFIKKSERRTLPPLGQDGSLQQNDKAEKTVLPPIKSDEKKHPANDNPKHTKTGTNDVKLSKIDDTLLQQIKS